MNRKNIGLIVLAFALCLVAGLIGFWVGNDVNITTGDGTLTLGTMPKNADQASHYVVVTVNNQAYEPYPLLEDETFTVTQENGFQNTLHISKDQVVMESANCDNQDCIHQGAVTSDNREFRALGNKIVCLPNQVVVALYSASEIEGVLQSPLNPR